MRRAVLSEQFGEVKFGSNAEGSNTPLAGNASGMDSIPSNTDVRHFPDQ